MKRMKEGAYIAQRRMNGRCGAALAMSSTWCTELVSNGVGEDLGVGGHCTHHIDPIHSRANDVEEIKAIPLSPSSLSSAFLHNDQLREGHSIPLIVPSTAVNIARFFTSVTLMSYHNEYQRTGIAASRAKSDCFMAVPLLWSERQDRSWGRSDWEGEDAPEALVPIVAALPSGIEASPLVCLGVYCHRYWKWRPIQLLEVLGRPLSALVWPWRYAHGISHAEYGVWVMQWKNMMLVDAKLKLRRVKSFWSWLVASALWTYVRRTTADTRTKPKRFLDFYFLFFIFFFSCLIIIISLSHIIIFISFNNLMSREGSRENDRFFKKL